LLGSIKKRPKYCPSLKSKNMKFQSVNHSHPSLFEGRDNKHRITILQTDCKISGRNYNFYRESATADK
jgi:hypothetical protein